MSWRQAANSASSATAATEPVKRSLGVALMRHLRHTARIQALQKRAHARQIELGIRRLDAQEEAVAGAKANREELNSGWNGMGRPFSASIPNAPAKPANRIVISKVTGMNAG